MCTDLDFDFMHKLYDGQNRILPASYAYRPYHEPVAALAKRLKLANTLRAAKAFTKQSKAASVQRV